MKRLALLLAVVFFGAFAFAQENDQAKVIALENVWNQAELHLDTHAIESVLTSDFVLTTFDGSVQTRDQYVATVKDKEYHPQVLASYNMKLHQYGNTVIVTGDYKEKGTEKGKPFEHHGRLTDTWVKENGRWLCAASALTELK